MESIFMDLVLRKIFTLLKEQHALIAVFGGLLIFFSWLITNTIEDNLNSKKNTLYQAKRWFEVDNNLDILRVSTEEISRKLAHLARSKKMHDPSASEAEKQFLRLGVIFDQAQETRQQIGNILNIIGSNLSLSLAIDKESLLHMEIVEMNDHFHSLNDRAFELENACHEIFGTQDYIKTEEVVSNYKNYIYNIANPQVQDAFPAAVEFSNRVIQTAYEDIQQLEKYSNAAKNLSLAAYALGSVMLFFGSAVEKRVV